jgi:hypothetical protein
MDLRFHHIERPGKLFCGSDGFFDGHGWDTLGHGHAEFRKQFLGLILMDVHGKSVLSMAESKGP